MAVVFGVSVSGCGGEGSDGPDGSGADIFRVGGRVEMYEHDLIGGLVLQNSGGDDLVIEANEISNTLPRPFTFDTKLGDGTNYAVTVLAPPDYQTCEVVNGLGTITGSHVDDLEIRCSWGPPEVTAVTPPDGSTIATNEAIMLQFTYPMNVDSLATTGTMGSVNMQVAYGDFEDVLLTLTPSLASWPVGAQTLIVDINGESGVPLPTLTLNYTVN